MKTLASYLLILALCLACYLPGIASIPIIDRDSAHFAQASRQMLQSHDYWTIRFQDKPRHLKPPGIYWLHVMSVKLFSQAQSNLVWPYVLVSVFGAVLAVLLTFIFTQRIYSLRAALCAAGFLAASPLLIIEAHLIVTDTTLLATIVLMQGALWQLYVSHRQNNQSSWFWAALFWLGMALGILIKGVSPLIAALTIISICIIDGNIRWLRHLRLYWGLPLVLALTAVWLIPLSVASHSNFLLDMWLQDAWPKIVSGQQSHGMPPGYFTVIFILVFWPGALFLWQTIYWTWQNRMQASVRFLLAWIIPVWLFFELVPTKLPEYILPAFPAISILTAQAVVNAKKMILPGIWRWLVGLQCCFWVFAGVLMLDGVMMMPYHFDHLILTASILVAVIFALTLLSALWAVWARQLTLASIYNILGLSLAMMVTLHCVIPDLHNIWLSKKIAMAVNQMAPQQINSHSPLLIMGYDEPSLIFLLGGKNVESTTMSMMITKLQHQPIHLVLLKENKVSQLRLLAHQAHITLKTLSRIHGFNYSKGHWVTLILLQRSTHLDHAKSSAS